MELRGATGPQAALPACSSSGLPAPWTTGSPTPVLRPPALPGLTKYAPKCRRLACLGVMRMMPACCCAATWAVSTSRSKRRVSTAFSQMCWPLYDWPACLQPCAAMNGDVETTDELIVALSSLSPLNLCICVCCRCPLCTICSVQCMLCTTRGWRTVTCSQCTLAGSMSSSNGNYWAWPRGPMWVQQGTPTCATPCATPLLRWVAIALCRD